MANRLNIQLRSHDRTHAARTAVPDNMTVSSLLENAQSRWKLPQDTRYSVINAATGKQLSPDSPLSQVASDNDELIIQPEFQGA